MPPISRNKRFSKAAQNSVFAQSIAEGVVDPKSLMDAIDFIEGPNGIGIVLRPVQRVIVKAIYGVPFDKVPEWSKRIPDWGKVPMYDMYRDKKTRPDVTEAEYLEICFNENRCNIKDWRDIPNVGTPYGGFNEACIFAGRRGGKSELVAAIAAYKLYLLLNIRSPQEYFGLVSGSNIDFTFLAQDEKGAGRLFKKLREQVNRANWFAPFLRDNNTKDLSFVSLADRDQRDINPTITVSCLPCTTNAVRSPSSVFLALDEFAHFRSAKGSTSDDMYAAATPSTGDFHHVTEAEEQLMKVQEYGSDFGEEASNFEETEDSVLEFEDKNEMVEVQDSMILSISSPLKKIGKMYELHRLALDEGVASGIFTLNCPSAEMNPKLLPRFLKSEHKKNPLTFKAEYGGKFLESSESYVTEVAVKKCTDCKWDERGLPIEGTARLNLQRFSQIQVGRNYFWGFDLGMVNDASALAIGHLEPGGPHGSIKLVYDYIDRMMVGESGEWPGVRGNATGHRKYIGYQVLPLEDILDWLEAMNKCLPCFRGATDQHGGQQLVQLLGLKQINNVELVNLTPAINSQMAYALRGYIESERCSFPLVPKFIQELKLVELEVASKYQIRVAAPQEKGAHDDMADAAMLVAFLAQRWLMEQGNMMDPSGLSLMIQAQANKPAGALLSLDGVNMQTLKVLEKLKTTEKHSNMYAGTSPVSPWHKRGRR